MWTRKVNSHIYACCNSGAMFTKGSNLSQGEAAAGNKRGVQRAKRKELERTRKMRKKKKVYVPWL